MTARIILPQPLAAAVVHRLCEWVPLTAPPRGDMCPCGGTLRVDDFNEFGNPEQFVCMTCDDLAINRGDRVLIVSDETPPAIRRLNNSYAIAATENDGAELRAWGPIPWTWTAYPLPLGRVVGSITADACLQALADWDPHDPDDYYGILDWIPDLKPGGCLMRVTDAAPTTERCPDCWGWALDDHTGLCERCGGRGVCEPYLLESAAS